MQTSEFRRATAAAMSVASAVGLTADDAIVLHDSNKLTLRLLPCDVVARVAPAEHQVAQFEIELAQLLAASGCPVAAVEARVEPRVYERDGFAITLWTYYEPAASGAASPADYANALERLHAGLRTLDVPAPHFGDRVEEAQRLVANRDRTPALADGDRELLGETLRNLRRAIGRRDAVEQLLHGEPHPGNVLTTKTGLLFVDLETCCRGPVEFDLAHAPADVSEHYPDVDQGLLRDCRTLALAVATAWRWDRDDQLKNGRQLGAEWLSQIRAAVGLRPEKNHRMPVPFVRPATLADADAIGLVHVRSWQSAYRGKMPQDFLDGLDPAGRSEAWQRIMEQARPSRDGIVVAAAEGGGVAGFASFGPSRDSDADPRATGEVFAIYVDPDAWGTGTGRTLMGSAIAELTRLGYADAILWVLDTNDRARRFYALAGWAEDGARKTDGSRGFDITEIRYRRTLGHRA